MLAMLEKLINEHGSSSILRERLELFSDKYTLLEEKASHLEQRNKALETELTQANEKIVQLETAVSAHEHAQKAPGISEETQSILKILFNNDDIDPRVIAHQLSMDPGLVEYHLNILDEKELAVIGGYTSGNPLTGSDGSTEWIITPHGRKYVVEIIGI